MTTVNTVAVAQFSQADADKAIAAKMQQAAMAQVVANRQVESLTTIPVKQWNKADAIEVQAKIKKPASKASLARAARLDKIEQEQVTIASLLTSVGMHIGALETETELLRIEAQVHIEQSLREAMKLGLQESMLSGRTVGGKKEDCYMLIVSNMQDFRVGAGLAALSDKVRDNYLCKIRAFVRDRGANKLDLYGNEANKARNANAGKGKGGKAPATNVGNTNPQPISEDAAYGNLAGVPVLLKFMNEWLAVNSNVAALNDFTLAAQDFAKHATALAKAKGIK